MVTVIIPVLNEEDNIVGVLDALVKQSLPPDEVIVVDGGSTDRTVEYLETFYDKLPLRILHRPHGNISISRNLAVQQAIYDIIAATDAGTRVHPNWLAEITQPLRADPSLQMVGGFYNISAKTPFQSAVGAIDSRLADEIEEHKYLPHSRSIAFRRSAWQAVGGYPEWLDYGEDLIFAWRIKFGVGLPTCFVPQATLLYEPQKTLSGFFWQYYRYARGDGKAGLWWKRHLLRYVAYLVILPSFLVGVRIIHWGLLLLLFFIGFYYLHSAIYRLWNLSANPVAFLWLPLARLVGDVAKMIAYPVGLRWRFTHHPPNWREVN